MHPVHSLQRSVVDRCCFLLLLLLPLLLLRALPLSYSSTIFLLETHTTSVDCLVSEWFATAPCSATCGGVQQQYRVVLRAASGTGAKCPNLNQVSPCGLAVCPSCESTGAVWSECSSSVYPTCDDPSAPSTSASCNGPGCVCPPGTVLNDTTCIEPLQCASQPVDCSVSSWSIFGSCSATCDQGIQIFTRAIVTHAAHGGNPCPALQMTSQCYLTACSACASNLTFNSCPRTCFATCLNPSPACPYDCNQPRCDCDPGYVLSDNSTCIPASSCPPCRRMCCFIPTLTLRLDYNSKL